MRAPLVFLVLATTALLAPPASAASASLTIEAPSLAVEHEGAIDLTVRLELSGHWCPDGGEATVKLDAWGTNASVEPATTLVRFVLDDASHFAEPYRGEGVARFAVAGSPGLQGTVDVVATLQPETGDCFVPQGFGEAAANVTIHVTGPPAQETPRPPAPPPPTPAAEPTPTQPTAPPTNASTGDEQGRVDRLPPGGGYIGDYETPQESRDASAAGPLLVAAAVACGAFLLRRKR